MEPRDDEVKPVNEVEQALFEVKKKIYPRFITGWFNSWRWAMVWFTQLLFYGVAWLEWNGRQAVLFDLAARKFYIFGIVFWPQDFIYLAALLVISAFSLFLFTAIAGRLFCAYACPQTVYTTIFLWIERKIEGERNARMRRDSAPWSFEKMLRKLAKHGVWLLVALWTGITFVGYFTPIRILLEQMVAFVLSPWQLFWIFFYALATYGNAGWMREQVCQYMCPYARFQSAMFDLDTLTVTYDEKRGEPRGIRGKKEDTQNSNLGSCIDCGLCVVVCPTGIDIRNGLQYECISCAACVDACDQVMEKMDYPKGLIRYTSLNVIKEKYPEKKKWRRVFRARILVYITLVVSMVGVMALTLVLRSPIKMDIMADRSLPRRVENGAMVNVYRVLVMNTMEVPRKFTLHASGIPGISLIPNTQISVPAASNVAVPIRVRVEDVSHLSRSNKIYITLEDVKDHRIVAKEKAVFLVLQGR
jgi:cytochrome c oxidase accessory protein FixG